MTISTSTSMGAMQMEMGIAASTRCPARPGPRHPRRTGAARWWFARMRDAVRSAKSWEPQDPVTTAAEQGQLVLQSPPTRMRPAPLAA
ncbi:MAG: hypothetical protein JNK85_28755 [Verrucomicrobiales bacterium]|nr:hypothetical protein [Verrucomicrobiales bacterium]